jgi:hypothetical protein
MASGRVETEAVATMINFKNIAQKKSEPVAVRRRLENVQVRLALFCVTTGT